jgi:dihydroflavonol-4-reductase
MPESDPVPYVRSKIEQERAAFRKADALGLDLVTACPTICVGPHDYGLTESNAVIINYLKDPFRTTWPGGCNIVAVEDVARGHVLIAERGRPGQRYLLGGENLTWKQIHDTVSNLCGVPGPLMTATHTSSYLAAAFHETLSHFTGKRPLATQDQARMVGRYYWYDHSLAASLGYDPVSGREALIEAVSWLVTSDHVSGALRNTMTLAPDIYESRRRARKAGKGTYAIQND